MRRGRDTATFGSLDLLLDTICNAFGGIVFIALLLAVLTQNIPEAADGTYTEGSFPPSVLKLRSDLRMLEEETERLVKQVSEQDEPENQNPLSEMDQEIMALRAKVLSLEQVTQSGATEISRTEKEIAEAKQEIRELEKERKKITAKMERRRKENTEIRRLPVSQPSPPGARQYWMVVQKGRLHLISTLDGESAYYPEVIILEKEPDQITVTVLHERGQFLGTGSERRGKLKSFFDQTAPGQVVVQLIVDTESFKEFNYLKDQLVKKGYPYFFDIGELPIRFVEGSDFENF